MVAAFTNGFISKIDKCFHSLPVYNFLISTTNHFFSALKDIIFNTNLQYLVYQCVLAQGQNHRRVIKFKRWEIRKMNYKVSL